MRIWSVKEGTLLGTLRQGNTMFEDWLFDPQTEGRFDDLRRQAQEVRSPNTKSSDCRQAKEIEINMNLGRELLRERQEICLSDVNGNRPATLSKHQKLLKTLSKQEKFQISYSQVISEIKHEDEERLEKQMTSLRLGAHRSRSADSRSSPPSKA